MKDNREITVWITAIYLLQSESGGKNIQSTWINGEKHQETMFIGQL